MPTSMAFQRLMYLEHDIGRAVALKRKYPSIYVLTQNNHLLQLPHFFGQGTSRKGANIIAFPISKQHPTHTSPSGRRFVPDVSLALSTPNVLSQMHSFVHARCNPALRAIPARTRAPRPTRGPIACSENIVHISRTGPLRGSVSDLNGILAPTEQQTRFFDHIRSIASTSDRSLLPKEAVYRKGAFEQQHSHDETRGPLHSTTTATSALSHAGVAISFGAPKECSSVEIQISCSLVDGLPILL